LPVINELTVKISERITEEEIRIGKALDDIRLAEYEKNRDEDGDRFHTAIDEEGIFIVNAGTVLLHPFLKIFFNRIGIVSGNSFKSEKDKVTGVYLLHYLGTGRIEADEYELTLAKVLCAMPVETPVEKIKNLDPGFITEADLLIGSVLEQWSIL
jgi:hypothetical protein